MTAGLTAVSPMIEVKGFQQITGLGKSQAYDLVAQLPDGIVIRLGQKRIRLLVQPLNAWLASGAMNQKR